MIIIPGIIAGLINKEFKKAMFSGSLGVLIVWLIYMISAFLTKNAYINIDQFAGLIFGTIGYGWILILIILILGAVFGALGGGLGNLVIQLFLMSKSTDPSKRVKTKSPKKSTK